jgi:hypothetical protein
MAKKSKKRRRVETKDSHEPINLDGSQIMLFDMDEVSINAWTPLPNGEGDPTQVHLLFKVAEGVTTAIRFKGPDTLNAIVEQLTRYRDIVWPEKDEEEEPVEEKPVEEDLPPGRKPGEPW